MLRQKKIPVAGWRLSPRDRVGPGLGGDATRGAHGSPRVPRSVGH